MPWLAIFLLGRRSCTAIRLSQLLPAAHNSAESLHWLYLVSEILAWWNKLVITALRSVFTLLIAMSIPGGSCFVARLNLQVTTNPKSLSIELDE